MKKMNEIYKDTFIYKVCEELELTIKELALVMGKTLKCIENWRKDGESIPAKEKQYMKLLMKNKRLEEELIKSQKHRVISNKDFKPNLNGDLTINEVIKGLKKLVPYRLILEEI